MERVLSGIARVVSEDAADAVASIIARSFARQATILGMHPGDYPNYVAFETPGRVRRRMSRGDVVVLGDVDAEPVGTVSFSIDGDVGAIKRLGVLPAHRGRDLGCVLMAFAEAQLLARGASVVELDFVAQFDGLRRFYERLGYRVYREESVPSLPFRVAWTRKTLRTFDLTPGSAVPKADPSDALFEVLRDRYGIGRSWTHLGGGYNLNLLVDGRWVVRVYRPWVTPERLAFVQDVRAHAGVPVAGLLRTRDGAGHVVVDDRVAEVESYVAHDSQMDSWEPLERGLPTLGRMHAQLRAFAGEVVAPAWANHVEAEDALAWTLVGTCSIRERVLGERCADLAEELAQRVFVAERGISLPRQIVHGDFWDNNVFFREGRVVLVGDFDFAGVRNRIDDLALTLFFASSSLSSSIEECVSDARLAQLRRLVDAYDTGLDEPLSEDERAALPLATARCILHFIGEMALLDDPAESRYAASRRLGDVEWCLQMVRDLPRWQAGLGR